MKILSVEVGLLFGPSFTSALLQVVDEDSKLQKVAASGRGKSLRRQQKNFSEGVDEP